MSKFAWLSLVALVATAALPACATNAAAPLDDEATAANSAGQGGSGSGTGGGNGDGGSAGGKVDGPKCGDGSEAVDESCDDGNADNGDGCTDGCDFEPGWTCSGEPSVCLPTCGDGLLRGDETCDDGDKVGSDGCSPTCAPEYGYVCAGEPSECATVCGDGIIAGKEACDDDNDGAGDGCSEACATENGYECAGVPSICTSICGDGVVVGMEGCDDDNTAPDDGCDASCEVEVYYTCIDEPSTCTTPCGDGFLVGTEACDDKNLLPDDGCTTECAIETGYECTGAPSVCTTICGDGVLAGAESCDDGNPVSKDGCSASCKIEPGFVCVGSPSTCSATCGDGFPAGAETCDDANTLPNDGCSATCKAETGYVCSNIPSVCQTVCGDGVAGGAEECDDGNQVENDGCSMLCKTQAGFTCAGVPTVCTAICGDGIVVLGEECDDANLADGDCCSSTCTAEAGCEIEPNPTIAEANDYTALAVANQLKGFIKPLNDTDFFKLTIPTVANATATLTAETLDGFAGSTCAGTENSVITLYDENGLSLGTDDNNGPGNCALLITTGLEGGDYYIEVKAQGAVVFDYILQLTVDMVLCGDGTKAGAEQCDDGNNLPGDGCTAACLLETAYEIEPNETAAQATANGLFPTNKLWGGSLNPANDNDFYAFEVLATSDVKIETFDGTGPNNCATVDTIIELRAPNGTTILASDDDDGPGNCSIINPANDPSKHLLPGTYFVRVRSYNGVVHAAYTVQITFTAICNNGIQEGSEQCDGGLGCDANCNKIAVCGDGVVDNGETCDDQNPVNNDGCSSACQQEFGYACAGAPSTCTQIIPPCNAGQTLLVYTSTNVPKAIPDPGAATSVVQVLDAGTVQRAIVWMNITHTWVSDVDISLKSPAGPNIDLSSDNGGSGDNYSNTIFDNACVQPITSGSPPYSGCYQPEQSLAAFNGQSATGTWTLTCADDLALDTGTLNSWGLALCVTP